MERGAGGGVAPGAGETLESERLTALKLQNSKLKYQIFHLEKVCAYMYTCKLMYNYPMRMHSRGKVICLYVCVVSTKIARSRDLRVCV